MDTTSQLLDSHVAHFGAESLHVTLLGAEPPITLDTIQEDKEGSISSESAVYLESDDKEEASTAINDPKSETETGEKEERKINVQWMNDDDDEDDGADPDDDKYLSAEVSHPDIDRGWAWVVLVSVFAIFVVQSGLVATTGLYYVKMLDEFGHSRSYTAWMGSLINAFLLLAGPVSSAFIKRTGCRAAIIFGAVLMVVGYIMSAFATSLSFIFFSYGVVVACGINFVYSGQIIALAQYFSRWHSIATSLSMVGIGTGMFIMIRVIDYVIVELGWRNSFIICAGISLQIVIFAFLIFPLKVKIPEINLRHVEDLKNISQEEINYLYCTPAGRRLINEDNISMKRSVSSLRLSVGAGYLSSSLASLSYDKQSMAGSNQHSFCSRGIGSNQPSFLYLQNSHLELANGALSSLRSNQHSFCSRGSFYGIHSLKSNPHSFSIKSSQLDLHHSYQPQLPPLKDGEGLELHSKYIPPLARSLSHTSYVRGLREQQNSVIQEEDVDHSKCYIVIRKLKSFFGETVSNWNLALLLDGSFWCMNVAMFCSTLATVKLFIIYKDLSEALGVGEYYSVAMSILGLGDMLGRLSGGIISSAKWGNPLVCYMVAIVLCGLSTGLQLLVNSGPAFLFLTACFGITYGQQMVLVTIAPAVLFGRDMLVTVFGYCLFFGGIGALIGAPIAGFIVDRTGSFVGVIALSVGSSLFGGVSMFLCFIQHRRKNRRSLNLEDNTA